MSAPLGGDPFEGGPPVLVTAGELSSLWAWLMAGLSLVAIGVAIVGNLFPPALGLDLVALWPLPSLASLFLLLAMIVRSRGILRIIPPLVLVTWLILGIGWWSVGAPSPPSRAADIIGPTQVPAEVAMGIETAGDLVIGSGPGAVYSTRLLPRGGNAGAPDVLEAREGDVMALTIQERADSGWYRSGGWEILLHPAALWQLDISADGVDLDLRQIVLKQLDINGDGTISLGDPSGLVIVDLQGALSISVPAGVPVQVIGTATVPASWESTETGSQSPVTGDGYLITTGGGPRITITER